MEKGKEVKGLFFKKAPDVHDFINAVDVEVRPGLDLLMRWFDTMNENGGIDEPLGTVHSAIYAALTQWERVCDEALRLNREKGTPGKQIQSPAKG